ncbi:hypothetical protein AHF37_11928 [Paragonimus kellicotti]|nr:hypothetical protein AHF37_11928 [Paragonimus kellicotti]
MHTAECTPRTRVFQVQGHEMPKARRKRVVDAGANVIGGRDVQKLQRLLRQNINEEETPSKRFKTQDTDSSDSESLKADNDLTTDREALSELPHSDVADEYKADWENFFGHSEADKEYISQLQKNLTEAKLKVCLERVLSYLPSILSTIQV